MSIHDTAIIDDSARIASTATIGPYCVIGPGVVIGEDTVLMDHVSIQCNTSIGDRNSIYPGAVIGVDPQDRKYEGETTRCEIGNDNMIREHVTIHRGTDNGGGLTVLGSRNLLMVGSHVAHDCEIEDHVILGNGVLLAGHVLVEHHANLSGMAGAVAFVTVGAYSYVGAMTRMSRDVPPYMIVEGHDSRVRGVNVIGLERAGLSTEDSDSLRAAFRRIFRSGQPRRPVLEEMRGESTMGEHVLELVNSMSRTEIGYKGRYSESLREVSPRRSK